MRPIKYKELLPEIAERCGQPQQVIETILMKAFWPEVRKQLSGLKHSQIQILNLGTFTVKTKPLKTKLNRRRLLLEKVQGESPQKLSIRRDVSLEIQQMEQILEMKNSEAERRRSIRENR